MIEKEEIIAFAENEKLLPTTIEKDYVLSWVLAGINEHSLLSKILVFKGGTCLKKCFFGKYRFSEDLDFVLLDKNYLSAKFFLQAFEEVCMWVREESNIQFLNNYSKFEEYQTPRNLIAIQGRIRYRGPLLHRSNFPKIKIDISSHEPVITEPKMRKILHNYSDELGGSGQIISYSFEEMFAEKIRALADRARPRDLFDVIYLNRQTDYLIDKPLIRSILVKKCKSGNILYPSLSSIKNHPFRNSLSREWKNMLGHQISPLNQLEEYLEKLPALFEWLS